MLIIPSIEISNGKVVDKIHYTEKFDFFYNEISENPIDLCKLWRSENAKTLHINDLDGTSESPNKKLILDILECLDIPVSLSSMSNSIDDCEEFLDKGIFRVALCQFLIENPNLVKSLLDKYSSSRIVFFSFVKDEELILKGRKSGISFKEYLKLIQSVGATRLMYGNLDWNNSDTLPDFSIFSTINKNLDLKISVLGGVHNFRHLQALRQYKSFGVDSVILSKPLYENNFPCQQIWRIAETS